MGLGQNKRNSSFFFPRICSFSIVIHQLSCGVDHTAFVAKNGYLYTMGSNALGKLGLGQQSLQNSFQPQLVNALSKYKVFQVSCGHSHTCAVIDSGELFSWGDSSEGQLGINSNGSFYLPQLVNFSDLKGINTFVSDISCGYYHTVVVLRSAQVCAFGSGKKGQLGTGNYNKSYKPILLNTLNQIIKVKCGHYHTLFLDESGRVYSTGLNDEGQLGLGHKDGNMSSPKPILELEHSFIKKIYAGSHSAAISDSNEVYFFGKSYIGEFLYPQLINIGQAEIKDISIGNNFGVALTNEGNVFSWGVNESGQLGQGDNDVRLLPSLVESLLEKKVQSISCGDSYVICLGQLNDTQSKMSKSFIQKDLFKYQSPPTSNHLTKDNQYQQSQQKRQSPQKGMIKSQSQLIVANKYNLVNELQKQSEDQGKLLVVFQELLTLFLKEQNQQNGVFLANGFNNKIRSSKSFNSPSLGSGIFGNSNQFSPDKSQQAEFDKLQEYNSQIINQKDAIIDQLCFKSIQEKLKNHPQFQTGQKKQNQSESMAELSTKDGIKQSPPIYFDTKSNNVQDFSNPSASQQDNHNFLGMQEPQKSKIEIQNQERSTLLDQIKNLERQIINKNEFIINLQNENKSLKEQNQRNFQSEYFSEREQQWKREKCDILLENARLQEDNTQLMNVLKQQADQISELMKENKELNVKIKNQIHQHEIQNKQVNQKLVSYTEKIQDLERIYADYNSQKSELQIKDDRIQILEDQTIYLKRQLEMQAKSQNQSINEAASKYSIHDNTMISSKGMNNSNPLSMDISNQETIRNKITQDKNAFKRVSNNSIMFNASQINENQNPIFNRNQLINEKYSHLHLPNEDFKYNGNTNRFTPAANNFRDNFQQQPQYTPSKVQPYTQQTHQLSVRSPSYSQFDQSDQAYPYQQNSILKNSPLKVVNLGSNSRIVEDQTKHNVSFTDLDQLNMPLNSSIQQNQRGNSTNTMNLANKTKSLSVYQPNGNERKKLSVQVNPGYTTQINQKQIGNTGNGYITPISTKFAQSPQQQFSSKQNLLNMPQTTAGSSAARQLDFLAYQKPTTSSTSHTDQEFQKSLSRTKQQLEQRMNELNRKLSNKNIY